jgi:KRAB domain-containing zinc finger protein
MLIPFRFFCYSCIKPLPDKKSLTQHNYKMHSKRIRQCEKCGEQFRTTTNLANHIKSKHIHLRPFICDHPGCTSTFKDPRQLDKHTLSHFPSAYECFLCQRTYKTYFNIRKHLHNHHCPWLKKYKCDVCNKAFATNHNLRDHRHSHNVGEPKLYRCKKCPSSFTRCCSLHSHIDKVHRIVRYHCKHCEKRYADKKSLFVHLFNHRGDKPVSCKQIRNKKRLLF